MTSRRAAAALLLALAAAPSLALAQSQPPSPNPALDPKVLTYTVPKDIKWEGDPKSGNVRAFLYGDPGKPGAYAVLVKFFPGGMTRPHIHPKDRHVVVLSGVWWAGVGTVFDPGKTVAMTPGTFIHQFAGQPHFDGAKDVETIVMVSGEGPAGSRPAEAGR